MRATTDLLTLRHVFTQQRLLSSREFIAAYNRRVRWDEHVYDWDVLDVLHRAGILVPFFRFDKSKSALKAAAAQDGLPEGVLAQNLDGPSATNDVLQGRTTSGSVVDPRTEPYRPWYRYGRLDEAGTVWTSSFFYSPYQLLLVPTVRSALRALKRRRRTRRLSSLDISFSLPLSDEQRAEFVQRGVENTEQAIVLTSLETRYLPTIRGHGNTIHLSGLSGHEYDAYVQEFDPRAMLAWVGWDAEKIRQAAAALLHHADSLDPLVEWYALVRLCHADQQQKLRGDALVALDHRISAELLLQCYEDLVRAHAAPPLEPSPRYAFGPYDRRLRSNVSDLDAVLMEFGLSPHPSLVLVVEGETEWVLVPRVMELLGIPRAHNFIDLYLGQGVDADYGVLASYVSVPKLGEEVQDFIMLTRPPTHFLVVADPEGRLMTEDRRRERQKVWLERVLRALPPPFQTPAIEQQLHSLIHVETWGDESFEFAHFNDHELATAMETQASYRPSTSGSSLQQIISNIRKSRGNLEKALSIWHYPSLSKPELAEALWPTLEEKLRRAIGDGTLPTIPIARVLLEAAMKASQLGRRGMVMLSEAPEHDSSASVEDESSATE